MRGTRTCVSVRCKYAANLIRVHSGLLVFGWGDGEEKPAWRNGYRARLLIGNMRVRVPSSVKYEWPCDVINHIMAIFHVQKIQAVWRFHSVQVKAATCIQAARRGRRARVIAAALAMARSIEGLVYCARVLTGREASHDWHSLLWESASQLSSVRDTMLCWDIEIYDNYWELEYAYDDLAVKFGAASMDVFCQIRYPND